MKRKTKNYHDTLMNALKNPAEAVEYLSASLEEADAEQFLFALRNVAEATRGIAKLSKKTRLNRESLYRMLSKKGNPEFYSLNNILKALGFKLTVATEALRV